MTEPWEAGDPAFMWNEANAANDDGQAVIDAEREAARLHLAQVADATRAWARALADAQTAVGIAQRMRGDLAGLDFDFDDSSTSDAAKTDLGTAWHAIGRTIGIADDLLKLIVAAEQAAEIGRLRAANEALERRLAAHCSICGQGVDDQADFDLAPGTSKPCHSPAAHGYCGYNPPSVRCGNPDHHDHLGDGADPGRRRRVRP